MAPRRAESQGFPNLMMPTMQVKILFLIKGTKNASKCTLILTEGDSAKTLAMAGIEVVGRDEYGCFPLRGKFLNVREASMDQIGKNEEVQNIMKILGLKFNTVYNDVSSLRYGKLMIMADQDHDGSHIKGLIINFIHNFWPSLIKLNNFLQEFVTPILKVSKYFLHLANPRPSLSFLCKILNDSRKKMTFPVGKLSTTKVWVPQQTAKLWNTSRLLCNIEKCSFTKARKMTSLLSFSSNALIPICVKSGWHKRILIISLTIMTLISLTKILSTKK
jgi:hypothetical protein